MNFYREEVKSEVRAAPKITNKHIFIPPFKDMKVKLATQVLSNSVTAGMHFYILLNRLPPEAIHTANFISQVDNLFDVLSSLNLTDFKKYRAAMKEGS